MRTRIAKWGNSLALRLPSALASSQLLREGSEVEITETAGGILLRPAATTYDLEQLLNGVRKSNQHGSVDTGAATGKEAW